MRGRIGNYGLYILETAAEGSRDKKETCISVSVRQRLEPVKLKPSSLSVLCFAR